MFQNGNTPKSSSAIYMHVGLQIVLVIAVGLMGCSSGFPPAQGTANSPQVQITSSPRPLINATNTQVSIPNSATIPLAHDADVQSLAFSSDGSLLAVGTTSELALFRTATLERLWTASVQSTIGRIALDPDNTLLVTGYRNQGQPVSDESQNGLLLWDAATGQEMRTLLGNQFGSECLSWSADGQYIASASTEAVIIWKTQDYSIYYRWGDTEPGFASPIVVQWAPTSPLLAIGTFDGRITMLDTESRRVLRVLSPYTQEVSGTEFGVQGIVWSPDSRQMLVINDYVAQNSPYGKVSIWDVETGNYRSISMYEPENPDAVAWISQDILMVVDISSTQISVYNVLSSHALLTIDGRFDSGVVLAISSNGEFIAVKASDGSLHLYQVECAVTQTGC